MKFRAILNVCVILHFLDFLPTVSRLLIVCITLFTNFFSNQSMHEAHFQIMKLLICFAPYLRQIMIVCFTLFTDFFSNQSMHEAHFQIIMLLICSARYLR